MIPAVRPSDLSDSMKSSNRFKTAAALVLMSISGVTFAQEQVTQVNHSATDWTPYSFDADTSYAVPLYSNEFDVDYLDSEALSIGLEDENQGFWKFSLDLKQPQTSMFSEEQYQLNASYSPESGDSTFYINYGNRRVPVSIKVDNFLDYNKVGPEGSGMALGFEQNVNDNWAVSISYTKSELEQSGADNSVFSVESGAPINQQYWFDLNKDGLPEAVNLFSDLGIAPSFDKASDGIEIRLTRQVGETLSVGSTLFQNNNSFDWEPFQLEGFESIASELKESGISIFSQIDFSSEWSIDTQLTHKSYQQKSPQIVSLVSEESSRLDFDNTTLDIGVQYQGRWQDMGLVIRIDLVNLLGQDSAYNTVNDFNEKGLMPYTFDSPKYIKLSGSINF